MYRLILLAMLSSLGVSASAPSISIWSPEIKNKRDELCKPIVKWVAGIQALHPEYEVYPECGFTYGKNRKLDLPVKKTYLSPEEISELHRLRAISYAAFKDEESFKEKVMLKHGVPEFPLGSACWHYRGIRVDDDYITDDPNSSFPSESCDKK